MRNAKVIVIALQNAIVKKHKQIAIKIVKKTVQRNVIAKKINVIVKRKNANVTATKIANAQKKNVIADAKKAKNAHARIAIVTTENAVKRKDLNYLRKNVNVKKIAQKKQIAKNQNAIAKNKFIDL